MNDFIYSCYSFALFYLDQPLLNVVFYGNTIRRYIFAAILFFAIFGAIYLIRYLAFARTKTFAGKQGSKRKRLGKAVRKISPFFFLYFSLYPTIKYLYLPEIADKVADAFLTLLLIIQVARFVHLFIEFGFFKQGEKRDETMLHAVKLAATVALWAIGILLVLSSLGYDITTLAASLGISGIVVAFAARGILEDLFASYSIYFDRPFQIGDSITVGVDSGTVKYIGLKTTRLQSLAGHELVISNKELTNVRVNNNTHMTERRVVLHFGVDYGTSTDQLNQIPEVVKNLIEAQPLTRFDRAHLFQFGEFGLQFEAVYFVLSSDYLVHMDIQQAILLGILEECENRGIVMTINGQSLYFMREKLRSEQEGGPLYIAGV